MKENAILLQIFRLFLYIHKYHSPFVSKGIVQTSQIFLRDTLYQNDLAMRNTADVQRSYAIFNPLVAFYDIQGRYSLFVHA
jgi:hypothetical protein